MSLCDIRAQAGKRLYLITKKAFFTVVDYVNRLAMDIDHFRCDLDSNHKILTDFDNLDIYLRIFGMEDFFFADFHIDNIFPPCLNGSYLRQHIDVNQLLSVVRPNTACLFDQVFEIDDPDAAGQLHAINTYYSIKTKL